MDDLAHQLLLAHLSGETAGPGGMADIVAQIAGDDPQAQQVVAALRQRESLATATPDDEPDDLDDDVIDIGPTPGDRETADLLTRLYDEVELLRARSDRLADALGACRRCFGEDALCPVCHGRGTPGGRAPDPVLFAELVAPAHARVSMSFAAEDASSTTPTRRATHAIR
jgi:hypothetical protein